MQIGWSWCRKNQDDFLTFILCVCCEGEGVRRYDQAPQFAQEHSKHSHCEALVLSMIQEVDRTVKSSSRYLESTRYQPHIWMSPSYHQRWAKLVREWKIHHCFPTQSTEHESSHQHQNSTITHIHTWKSPCLTTALPVGHCTTPTDLGTNC